MEVVELVEEVDALGKSQVRMEQQVNNLEQRFDRHETKQNGTLEKLNNKMDSMTKWLIGVLGGVIAALILLVINISIASGGGKP